MSAHHDATAVVAAEGDVCGGVCARIPVDMRPMICQAYISCPDFDHVDSQPVELPMLDDNRVIRRQHDGSDEIFSVRARVIYSYHAQNDDELTLSEGQTLTVLDQNLEDAGWWKGDLNGKVGVFPDNFVSLIQDEEPPLPDQKPRPKPPNHAPSHRFNANKDKKRPVPPPMEPEPTPVLPGRPGRVSTPPAAQVVVNKPPPTVPHSQTDMRGGAMPPAGSSPGGMMTSPVMPSEDVSALRAEIDRLKSSTVSKESFEQLQRELNTTRDSLEAFKRETMKKIVDLMNEIDEEKKSASQNKVEMARLRKLAEDSWMGR